jgi:hypothetical protein
MTNVVDFSEFIVTDVIFKNPVIKYDRHVITRNIISIKKNKGLLIRTPLMKTFGIEDGERNKVHDGKFKVKTIFPNDTKPESRIETFKKKIIELDTKIIQDAIAGKWLGENLSDDIVTNRYHPIFDINGSNTKTSKKSAFIKANVPNLNGTWDSLQIKDTNNIIIFPYTEGLLPGNLVSNTSKIICILNITQVWIKQDKSQWGVSVKLVECIVHNEVLQPVETECRPFEISEDDLADIKEMS